MRNVGEIRGATRITFNSPHGFSVVIGFSSGGVYGPTYSHNSPTIAEYQNVWYGYGSYLAFYECINENDYIQVINNGSGSTACSALNTFVYSAT